MYRVYKDFVSRRIALLLILFMALFVAPVHAQDDPAFTVDNVIVDVTSRSASSAREEAFSQAQKQAFDILMERLLSAEEHEILMVPEEILISPMVRDFEITDEKLSAVRYIGTYRFRFDDEKIKEFLAYQGLSYSDVSSQPVLILPYYKVRNDMILWGGVNPWLEAWQGVSSSGGLVPVVAPTGDLDDINDIGDNEALSFRQAGLESIVKRYSAREALIIIANPDWAPGTLEPQLSEPDSLNVTLYRALDGNPNYETSFAIDKSGVKDGQTLFDGAVDAVRRALRQDWQTQTSVNAYQSNNLRVRVRFDGLQEWLAIKSKLDGLGGIDEINVLSLTPGEAQLELFFSGSEGRLRLALAQSDMTLTKPQIDIANLYGAGAQAGHSALVYDLYMNDRP